MNINSLQTAPLLVLGNYDSEKVIDKKAYLSKYHSQMALPSHYKDNQFKDERAAQQPADVINNVDKMYALMDDRQNQTINIHWSGIGSYNFSAGCQVIGGASYVNHKGQIIDDGLLAAKNKGELHKVSGHNYTGQKTKGAYNMLIDLFMNYTADGMNSLVYSLVREETIGQLESWPTGEIDSLEAQMESKI